jgi:hypothetical protein
MNGWSEGMVDTLLDCKVSGMAFEAAWLYALVVHPPRGRDLGPSRPTLLNEDGTLPEESPVEFLRRVADDAWHGRKPLLRHTTHLRELIDNDRSTAAASTVGHRRPRMDLVA